MKKLILTLFSVALVVWAVHSYAPDAECQVGAPCGTTQSSITIAGEASSNWLRGQATPPPIDLADLSIENTATAQGGFTLWEDRQATSDTEDSYTRYAGGASVTGTVDWDCTDAYAPTCGEATALAYKLVEVDGDCVPGTSGTASSNVSLTVQVPSVGCVAAPTVAIPAPPNDQVSFTFGDVMQTYTGTDSWVAELSAPAPYTNPTAYQSDACSANLFGDTSDVVDTWDDTWLTSKLEATVAAGATGLCCVTETAFQTPAQSGCVYQGGSIEIEATMHMIRCGAAAAPPGADAGDAATDVCAAVLTASDSNNVCPQDWCTLNPGDPPCGGP